MRSFLYGRADNTLAQNEDSASTTSTFAAGRNTTVNEADISRRVSPDVYVTLLNRSGQVVLRRPSGSTARPDPAPILTGDIPCSRCPTSTNASTSGATPARCAPTRTAVVLGSTGDPDGQYRTVAVTVPQGTLVTSISLNPTNDTLASLRRVELLASLAVLLAMGVLVMVVVRRGLRPLRRWPARRTPSPRAT